jgi:CotH kinase protein
VDETIDSDAARREFFDRRMYMIAVDGWPSGELRPERPVLATRDGSFRLWRTSPSDARHVPPPGGDGVLATSRAFSLVNSGNRTLRVPKRSWKVDFHVDGGADEVAGMSCLNLKAMYNDPAQMREALAWRMFGAAGVPSSRHTYAKFAINDRYLGLFSVVEQVDRSFLREHFGKNHHGNLYKAYCGGLDCATLEHRVGSDGTDGGRQYAEPGSEDATYRLKTNEDDPAASSYDDLAALVRTVNGVGLPGGDERFDSDVYRDSVQRIFNATGFLRWAGVNVLIGAWDNYFATPANYYLYNSGRKGESRDFVADPYFTFIPWDYDNSFGIDYFGTRWQYTDLLDWPSNTGNYGRRNGGGHRSHIPLVQHLLANHGFRQYYLDHLEFLLDTSFTPQAVAALIGTDGGDGLWERVRHAAYLESDTPYGTPFTGRQFTNDEVYRAGCQQQQLQHGQAHIDGIYHYVRMRYDSAREQLGRLRATYPSGASGATFPGVAEPLPQ